MRTAGVDVAVDNLMINLSNDILYGRTGNKRDEDDTEEKLQAVVCAFTLRPQERSMESFVLTSSCRSLPTTLIQDSDHSQRKNQEYV